MFRNSDFSDYEPYLYQSRRQAKHQFTSCSQWVPILLFTLFLVGLYVWHINKTNTTTMNNNSDPPCKEPLILKYYNTNGQPVQEQYSASNGQMIVVPPFFTSLHIPLNMEVSWYNNEGNFENTMIGPIDMTGGFSYSKQLKITSCPAPGT
jgi:hypothetical protein